MSIIKLTTGEKIEDLIKKNNINATILSNEIGVSKATISDMIGNVEKGYDYRHFLKIANYFNVSLDYLIQDDVQVKTRDNDLRFACDYTGLSEETIKTLAFQRYIDNNSTFFQTTTEFIEMLIAKIWSSAAFTININTLVEDISMLAQLYDAQILKRKGNNPIEINSQDENEIREIMERIVSLQHLDNEQIESLEDVVNSMKYKLSRFLNELLEEFALINSGYTLKQFEELENEYYKKEGASYGK